jgi:hypothetical protein
MRMRAIAVGSLLVLVGCSAGKAAAPPPLPTVEVATVVQSIRPLTVSDRVGNLWIITAGVKPGERVIVEGLMRVRVAQLRELQSLVQIHRSLGGGWQQ